MLMSIQSRAATSSDTSEVVAKKNQKDTATAEHSNDLFSVHNFDVTIDLAFPAGECYDDV